MNKNRKAAFQNLCDAEKTVLREKFIVIQGHFNGKQKTKNKKPSNILSMESWVVYLEK